VLETIDLDHRRKLIERIPCRVRLPPEWDRPFETEGCAPSQANEFRAGMRYRVCRRAVVQVEGGLPAFPRSDGYCGAIVQDFSRDGMGILYHEQLFPDERVRVLLPSISVDATVIRCRRCGPEFYELGLMLDRGHRLRELLA
jgi:hypothetical protein